MSDLLISAQQLGKKYRIRQRRTERYTALRDVLTEKGARLISAVSPLRRNKRRADRPAASEDFWALKDVSFDVHRGEVIGIVGRNGAGKSTLLKVLSRITEPSEGRAVLNGRVSSLLEVGTGFHPELSGRENIYLNGAILGMSRVEIKRKFDEIATFAEVEKFLETPVKRYSSGMYVRLAFAVAAHLEPDILIVDEVLAVGDARFQRKCIRKMEQVGSDGRTVIVVSHNMATITGLCQRALWLSEGRIRMDDTAEQVTSHYLREGAEHSGDVLLHDAQQDPRFAFTRLQFVNGTGDVSSVFDVRDPVFIAIEYDVHEPVSNLELSLRVYNEGGVPIFSTNRSQSVQRDMHSGTYASTLRIPARFLCAGTYTVDIAAHVPNVEVLSHLKSVATFVVEETGSGMASYSGPSHGVVLLDVEWQETPRQPQTIN